MVSTGRRPNVLEAMANQEDALRRLELSIHAGQKAAERRGEYYHPVAVWLVYFDGVDPLYSSTSPYGSTDPNIISLVAGQRAQQLIAAEQREENRDIHRLLAIARRKLGVQQPPTWYSAVTANQSDDNLREMPGGPDPYSTGPQLQQLTELKYYQPGYYADQQGYMHVNTGHMPPINGNPMARWLETTAHRGGVVMPGVSCSGFQAEVRSEYYPPPYDYRWHEYYAGRPVGPGICRLAFAHPRDPTQSGHNPALFTPDSVAAGLVDNEYYGHIWSGEPRNREDFVGDTLLWYTVPKGKTVGSWTCPDDGFLLGLNHHHSYTGGGRQKFIGGQVVNNEALREKISDSYRPGTTTQVGGGRGEVIDFWNYAMSPIKVNAGPGDWDPYNASNETLLEPIPTGLFMGNDVKLGEIYLCYLPEKWLRVAHPPRLATFPNSGVTGSGGYRLSNAGESIKLQAGKGMDWWVGDKASGWVPEAVTAPTHFDSSGRPYFQRSSWSYVLEHYQEVLAHPDCAGLAGWINAVLEEAEKVASYDRAEALRTYTRGGSVSSGGEFNLPGIPGVDAYGRNRINKIYPTSEFLDDPTSGGGTDIHTIETWTSS